MITEGPASLRSELNQKRAGNCGGPTPHYWERRSRRSTVVTVAVPCLFTVVAEFMPLCLPPHPPHPSQCLERRRNTAPLPSPVRVMHTTTLHRNDAKRREGDRSAFGWWETRLSEKDGRLVDHDPHRPRVPSKVLTRSVVDIIPSESPRRSLTAGG